MNGFPLRWCFKNSKAVLIKSSDLLHHWPSLVPVTLMEETIYQKPTHFKTLSAWLFTFFLTFSLLFKLKEQPFPIYKLPYHFPRR